jgi:crossover junction endodeoxyribonuclease RuvC
LIKGYIKYLSLTLTQIKVYKMKEIAKEKIILGIDPGTQLLGYGLIKVTGSQVFMIQYGILTLKSYKSMAVRLQKIFQKISLIIEEFNPDEVALESPFYGQNIQVALKLGRAQGVAMAAALAKDLPIIEYAPRKIKQSITGNGNASKEQVAAMLKTILKLDTIPVELDASDALAVALCHHYQKNTQSKGKLNWSSFIKENPDRIK